MPPDDKSIRVLIAGPDSPRASAFLDIINDIFDISKVEAGGVSLSETYADVRQVTQRVIHLVGVRAREAGLHIANDVPEVFLCSGATNTNCAKCC